MPWSNHSFNLKKTCIKERDPDPHLAKKFIISQQKQVIHYNSGVETNFATTFQKISQVSEHTGK